VHGCQKCGLCDFKTIKPRVFTGQNVQATIPSEEKVLVSSGECRFVYRMYYSRTGSARFFGHLELIQMFYRVMQRMGLPLNYSQGYNPSPKVSFSPALPLGTESLAEYLQVELSEPVGDQAALLEMFNSQLPEGFSAISLALHSSKVEQSQRTCYHVSLGQKITENQVNTVSAREKIEIRVLRKGKEKIIDAAPMIKRFFLLEDGSVELILHTETGSPALKPMEIIASVFGIDQDEISRAKVIKVSVDPAEQDGILNP
jgi:radical SAM-linked protein